MMTSSRIEDKSISTINGSCSQTQLRNMLQEAKPVEERLIEEGKKTKNKIIQMQKQNVPNFKPTFIAQQKEGVQSKINVSRISNGQRTSRQKSKNTEIEPLLSRNLINDYLKTNDLNLETVLKSERLKYSSSHSKSNSRNL